MVLDCFAGSATTAVAAYNQSRNFIGCELSKEYYKKLFVNYPDVLSVEEATTLLGFKSQTAIIRRIHQHRIRCLKVGRSFMIPKEYLIDYLLDS